MTVDQQTEAYLKISPGSIGILISKCIIIVKLPSSTVSATNFLYRRGPRRLENTSPDNDRNVGHFLSITARLGIYGYQIEQVFILPCLNDLYFLYNY